MFDLSYFDNSNRTKFVRQASKVIKFNLVEHKHYRCLRSTIFLFDNSKGDYRT